MSLVQDETKNAFASQGEVKRRSADSLAKDTSFTPEKPIHEGHVESDSEISRHGELYRRAHPFILFGLAAVILGWWVSATVLKATRHRWQVASFTCLQPEANKPSTGSYRRCSLGLSLRR